MTVTFHLINSSLLEEQRQTTEDDHQNKSDQGHLLNLTKANPAMDKSTIAVATISAAVAA